MSSSSPQTPNGDAPSRDVVEKVVDAHKHDEPTNSEVEQRGALHASSPASTHSPKHNNYPQAAASTEPEEALDCGGDSGSDADNELEPDHEAEANGAAVDNERAVDKIEVSDELNYELSVAQDTLDVVKELLARVFKGQDPGHLFDELDRLVPISLTSRRLFGPAVAHYLTSRLSDAHVARIGHFLRKEISQMLIHELFMFEQPYSAHLSAGPKEARLFVLRSVMHQKYPLLLTEGCASLSRPPVFYGTDHCECFKQGSVAQKELVWELFVEPSSFRNVPGRIIEHRSGGVLPTICLDVEILEQEIERDKAKGRLPCAVFASHMDDLEAIRALCDRHDLWLHVEGGSSSLLNCCTRKHPVPSSTDAHGHSVSGHEDDNVEHKHSYQDGGETATDANGATNSSSNGGQTPPMPPPKPAFKHLASVKRLLACANSVFAQPHDWWKFDHSSQIFTNITPTTLTFVRSDQIDPSRCLPPLKSVSGADFTMYFQLWLQLRLENFDELRAHVEHALTMCDRLLRRLRAQQQFFKVVVGPDPESLPHIFLFQIIPNTDRLDVASLNLDLNSFHNGFLLPQMDRVVLGNLSLSNSVYQQRACFLFQPLKIESVHRELTDEHIGAFIDEVVPLISMAELAIQMRRSFEQALLEAEDLEPLQHTQLNPEEFVGVGAFRFIPDVVKDNPEAIDVLNRNLADALSAIDPVLYQMGTTTNSEVCVRVAVSRRVLSPTFLPDLVDEIERASKQLSFPQEVIDSLADSVKEGIRLSEQRLEETQRDEYGADNLLRSVPLFGSIYGWAFPPDATAKQKLGQAFDLRSNSVKAPSYTELTKDSPRNASRRASSGASTPVAQRTPKGSAPSAGANGAAVQTVRRQSSQSTRSLADDAKAVSASPTNGASENRNTVNN